MNRRQFLHTSSGAAAGLLILNPRAAFGYEANSAIRHGLLGCGNRGTAVATSFSKNTARRWWRWRNLSRQVGGREATTSTSQCEAGPGGDRRKAACFAGRMRLSNLLRRWTWT